MKSKDRKIGNIEDQAVWSNICEVMVFEGGERKKISLKQYPER